MKLVNIPQFSIGLFRPTSYFWNWETVDNPQFVLQARFAPSANRGYPQLPNSKITVWGCLLALLLFSMPTHAQEQVSKKQDAVKTWSNLSDAEKKKLREALRMVWSDPKVISARENVNRSAREYQKAIKETIATLDPETAKLLDHIQRTKSGMLHTAMGETTIKRGAKGPFRSLEHLVAPPLMMDKMNDDQRKRFIKASAEARNRPEVTSALEKLKELGKEDEAIRQRKFEMIRNYRRTYFEALVQIDPTLSEFVPQPGSGHPFGGHKAKSKGSRKRKGESKGPQ